MTKGPAKNNNDDSQVHFQRRRRRTVSMSTTSTSTSSSTSTSRPRSTRTNTTSNPRPMCTGLVLGLHVHVMMLIALLSLLFSFVAVVNGQSIVPIDEPQLGGNGDSSAIECFQASFEPGCNDEDGGYTCQVAVCQINLVCCTLAWNQECVNLAQSVCYQQDQDLLSPDEDGDQDENLETGAAGELDLSNECTDQRCADNPGCCEIPACFEVVLRYCEAQEGNGSSPTTAPVPEPTPEPSTLAPQAREPDGTDPNNMPPSPQPPTSPDINDASNSCFQASEEPGCSHTRCQNRICNIDDYCCEFRWDAACIELASDNLNVCTEDWPRPDNTCFEVEPFGRPGCVYDNACLDLVCTFNKPCCEESYAESCVSTAKRFCELPEPTNDCYTASTLPACTDETCLDDAVCVERPDCCTDSYSNECVTIAKEYHTSSCPPPKATNDCFAQSPVGGCEDTRCARAVCDIQSYCCNSDTEVGTWDNICVRIAEEVCQPEVVDRPPGPCPVGFTCSDTEMTNCTELRNVARDVFEIGDIYAGIYCGESYEDGYNLKNCEIGHYCPTPEERYPCPEGFFCPHKTATPDIVCNRCEEGAQQLERDLFGYAGLVAIGIIITSFLIWRLIRRYNQDFVKKLYNFEQRVFLGRIREFEHRITELRSSANTLSLLSLRNKHSSQQETKKIRHKIELINRRLASLEESRSNTSAGTSSDAGNKDNNGDKDNGDSYNRIFNASGHRFFRSWQASTTSALDYQQAESPTNNNFNSSKNNNTTGSKIVRFDARRVFDALDFNSDGELSYDELNVILGLNDLELHEFVRRMNELAGNKRDMKSVTRPVFAKYFLQVLKETSNLTVSFEEAEVLFDEMVDEDVTKLNEIHMSRFYNSSMSGFLSDLQICDLIRRFKKLNAEVGNNSRRPSMFFSGSSNRLFRMPAAARLSTAGLSTRRRSSFRSQSSAGPVKDTRMVISREDFVENYPQLLLEITMDTDTVMGEPDGADGFDMDWQYPGVDICFKEMSLNIQIGEDTIKVVDEVTGRIRAKTMTALMGGSGAGKTSLLNALCGRAFYGEVTGSIYLNGHTATSIEHYKDSVGFVPQDDIVYPELTVRENLIYSGRFRLPKGTHDVEIEDLADTTMANLGLSRVADSPVGDVRRRGVSGGERKRVNIGLELMANPSILFLDEPTSGLDASSALLVMKSLKHLVEKDGVTVVSVIHQPRKFIYDLFDSLILLGVGGKMVYHGPRDFAVPYFNKLHYCLPEGESVADWLIDISSGRLEPDCQIAKCRKSEYMKPHQLIGLDADDNDYANDSEEEKSDLENDNDSAGVSRSPSSGITRDLESGNDDREHDTGASATMNSTGVNIQGTASSEGEGSQGRGSSARINKDNADSGTAEAIDDDKNAMHTADPKATDQERPVEQSYVGKNCVTISTTEGDNLNHDWEIPPMARGSMVEDILHSAVTKGVSGADGNNSLDVDDELELCEIGNSFQTTEATTEETTMKRVSSVGSFDVDTMLTTPTNSIPSQVSTGGMSLNAAGRCVTDKDCVGARGVTTGKVIQAAEEAKNRRAWLYREWNKHFDNLGTDQKKRYEPPQSYPLPVGVEKPSFFYQLYFQTGRIFTVAWRNRRTKFIDSIIIIGSMIVITALDGVAVVTEDVDPTVPFEVMVRPNLDDSEELFTGLFRFALTRQIQYALKAGIVICALVGLTATKVLTEKRLMFFREAASGYNLDAYFVAVNIMATTEHTFQVLVAAYFAIWIRNPLASGASFVVHFVLLCWVVVSWSLLIPMVTPPETVMIVGAFFFVFCALMFSGAFPPILYHQIYEEGGMFQEIFAGWIAATRFFFEAITVGEYRCLPEQTGYTISEEAINRAWNSSAMVAIGYAGHDPYATRKSCDGWYWSVIPAMLVGVTVRYAAWLCMYGFQRGEQTKKPLWSFMRSDFRIFRDVTLYVLLLAGLVALTTWTFVRDVPYESPDQEIDILDYII